MCCGYRSSGAITGVVVVDSSSNRSNYVGGNNSGNDSGNDSGSSGNNGKIGVIKGLVVVVTTTAKQL